MTNNYHIIKAFVCMCLRCKFVIHTIVGHAHRQALLKATVLALVSVPLLDLTAAFTLVILQFEANGPTEETLQQTSKRERESVSRSAEE